MMQVNDSLPAPMPGAIRGLHLAATPVLGLLALLSAQSDPTLCGPGSGISFNSMALMYGVMSLIHVGPWLTLASRSARHP